MVSFIVMDAALFLFVSNWKIVDTKGCVVSVLMNKYHLCAGKFEGFYFGYGG